MPFCAKGIAIKNADKLKMVHERVFIMLYIRRILGELWIWARRDKEENEDV